MSNATATPPIAIVTGAARGLGAAIAERLAQDGLDVGIVDLSEDACRATVARIEACGRRALAVAADVTDEVSVASAFRRFAADLGPPTVLVNNAGVLRENMMHKTSVADWDLVVNVNLRGAFLMCREIRAFQKAAQWGRIVNISSTAAVGALGQANYAAAKAGIQGLTKTLALELGPLHVTVNAVAPGFVTTEMTRTTAERLGITIEQFEADALRESVVGRVGRPEDIANAVAFFVDARSDFVTGQVLYVAGAPKV